MKALPRVLRQLETQTPLLRELRVIVGAYVGWCPEWIDVGDTCDLSDSNGDTYAALIRTKCMGIEETNDKTTRTLVLVHFLGWSHVWDEWNVVDDRFVQC